MDAPPSGRFYKKDGYVHAVHSSDESWSKEFYSCGPPTASCSLTTFVSFRPRLEANQPEPGLLPRELRAKPASLRRATHEFFLPCKNVDGRKHGLSCFLLLRPESLDRGRSDLLPRSRTWRHVMQVSRSYRRMARVSCCAKSILSPSSISVIYSEADRATDRATDRLAASQNVRSLPASLGLARSFLITEEAFRFHGYGAAQQGKKARRRATRPLSLLGNPQSHKLPFNASIP